MNKALRLLPSDHNLRWFVLASIVAHVLTAFLSSALSQAKPKQRQTIEIALAPAKGNPALEQLAPPAPPSAKPTINPPPAAVQPAPPPVATIEKPKVTPPAKPQSEKPNKPTAAPTPKVESPQPSKTSEPAAPAPPLATTPPPSSQVLGDVRRMLEAKRQQELGAGVEDGSGYALPTNVKGRLYFSQLQAAVTAAWAVPPGTRRKAVEIEILIGSTGKLLQRTIRLPSGDALFDRSAIAALDRANIPPPPAEFRTPLRMILHMIPPEE